MKNILVTGGLGFIGSNFIRMLLKSGEFDRVINFDKQTYAGNPENLQDLEKENLLSFYSSRYLRREFVLKHLEAYEVDAVVNFAAESHVDRSIDGPEPFVHTNVVGTLRLLESYEIIPS